MEKISDFKFVDGIYISGSAIEKFGRFEENYINVRNKEGRVLSIPEIQKLPDTPEDYVHHYEWEIRKKNIGRFLNHLSAKNRSQEILDIGCGNGFFSHMMARTGHKVNAVDVNLTELKQAKEAFPNDQIRWHYADIMAKPFGSQMFDLVSFCCSFQYFDKPKELLDTCLSILNPGGEIHIIDSPFYRENERDQAAKRSSGYFQSLGVTEMINHYHHNTIELFDSYNYSFGYKPGGLMKKILRTVDSPFPWIIVRK